jgi:hypothetical protein
MVRTLGGCVAVAICSAVQREYLNNRLSAFLSPTELAAVQKSSGFISQLPDDTRHRIGSIFGKSYNRQFQVMLAFAGLNVIITIVLALVRKRMGIFGSMPQRQDTNELAKAKEHKTKHVAEGDTKDDTRTAALRLPLNATPNDMSKARDGHDGHEMDET